MEKTEKNNEAQEKALLNEEHEEHQEEEEENPSAQNQTKEATETEKLKDQLLRAMAEYDNYRKRTARERVELEADVTAKVISELLPVADNLERALESECTDPNYKKGVEMIYSGFLTALEKLDVIQIQTDGEEFNPVYHQAVQKVSDENFESGVITQTFQKGYKMGEKAIRFAMVVVNDR